MPEAVTQEALVESGAAGYVVDRVVICDAFIEPDRHYQLLPGGKSKLVPGRRPSLRYRASAKQVKGGVAGVVGKEATLFQDMTAAEEQLNQFVNNLREEVREWREAGYPGAAIVTGRLLEWWFAREEERASLHQRFFFCQREAVETVVYLYEVRRRYKMPETDALLRYALKLATGTGKTLVMALIVVWSTLHKRKVAGSTLSNNFLVLVPNLTVRDRVRGIDERTNLPTGAGLDPSSPENLYDEFEMIPPEYRQEFVPNVLVRNWHAIPLTAERNDWVPEAIVGDGRFVPASVLAMMERRQKRDPTAPIKRFLSGWRDLIVINDEAHHVYGEKRQLKDEEPGYIKWSRIIEQVAAIASISLVVDLSATPWYGSGSPKPDGTLFEWLISDFSVYDAFESGLVKVVRLPDPDEQGRLYLDLWDLVKGAKTKEEYLRACRGALEHIYSGWKKTYAEWESRFEGMRFGPPPVMLVVANDATRAKWLFEHLNSYYDLFRNPDDEDPSSWVTIQVDSKVFDADRGNEATLREMVNTVGKSGKPGEHIRCIVSVNMLSEGWDVKNVSHIIGLRAFGSPLLTEQVIGRGLRRTDYTILNQPLAERLANVNRPDEETVDAFGIPFVGFPVERRKRRKAGKWGLDPVIIEPDPKKIRFSVWVPNVRSWAIGASEPLVQAIDIDSLEPVIINPKETPTEVRVRPVVGGQPEEVMTLKEFRRDYPLLRSTFVLARELYETVTPAAAADLGMGPTFDEVLEFVKAYLARRVRAEGSSEKTDIGMYYWGRRAMDILDTAVRGAPGGTKTIPIFADPDQLESGRVRAFRWSGITAKGRKCHLSLVPCHVELERQFADFLDGARDVVRYFKNERLGFSITYYENNRPRQYYPDFIILVRELEGQDVWWLAETKGEIRANTFLKREAAELWCDRMSRSGYGVWRPLFVPQRRFEKAMAEGAKTFRDLSVALAKPPRKTELVLLGTDDARVASDSYKTLLPVYSLQAAAGHFGEGRAVELEGWVEVQSVGKLSPEMFVARAVGRSMEPRINDGDYLVFRANPGGSREGKIVLARGPITDPDLGGPYTVKRYFASKVTSADGSWRHSRIVLAPLNPEFQPIEIEDSGDDPDAAVHVIAEYLTKLSPAS
jgi:type III restriction enzyme